MCRLAAAQICASCLDAGVRLLVGLRGPDPRVGATRPETVSLDSEAMWVVSASLVAHARAALRRQAGARLLVGLRGPDPCVGATRTPRPPARDGVSGL